MSKWKPIETAPKDGTQILLYDDWFIRYPIRIGYFSVLYDGFLGSDNECEIIPTHWMPLPEPPEK